MAVTNSRRSPLWLCELQKGFLKYPATVGDLTEAADVYVVENFSDDDKTRRPELWKLLEEGRGNLSALAVAQTDVKKIGSH